MGQKSSKQKKSVCTPIKTLHSEIADLLSIEELKPLDYDIENLVFSGGGAKDFSYPGAVKVLENLGILQKVKRFTGVGTAAIIAALLAVGFDCRAMQYLYNQLSGYLQIDSNVGVDKIFPENSSSLGCDSGSLFLDCLSQTLRIRSYASDLTFKQLYKSTGKELCIVCTNITKACTVYCHPKTTPDMPIRDAIFMSLTIPGIHALNISKSADIYAHGGLLCSYPIHCYDGWWLSMKPEDSLFNRLENVSQYHNHHTVFEKRNPKSLGFVLIDKYTENYNCLSSRLIKAPANEHIPNTCLGKVYTVALRKRDILERRLIELRHIAMNLCKNTSDVNQDEDLICESTLALKYLKDSRRSSGKNSPRGEQSFENCAQYVKALDQKDNEQCAEWLEQVLKKRILSMLEEMSNFYLAPINDAHSYFNAVFDVQHETSMKLNVDDFNRTIGIDSGYVVCSDKLTDEDKTFLYRQGWNATVAYLKELHMPTVGNRIAPKHKLNLTMHTLQVA